MRVVVACYQCGRAVTVDEAARHRQAFCGPRCQLAYHRSFITVKKPVIRGSQDVGADWPEMMVYLDRAQRRRPSYHAWSLFSGRKTGQTFAQSVDRFPQYIGGKTE